MRIDNGFEASSWMRTYFWNAYLEILAMDKNDDLCIMWLDVSKDTDFGGGRRVQCNR